MDLINEIQQENADGNLSNEQVRIFYEYINGATYNQIKKEYSLSCNNVIVRIVTRTIQLQFWCYGFEGGNDPYLPIRDLKKFGKRIIEFANDINFITSTTAIQLALDIHNSRYTKSIKFLYKIGKLILISHIRKREYIYQIVNELNLHIVSSQSLEFGRRFFCDFDSIVKYFTIYGRLFGRDRRLIINMDETSLSSKKRLKVISQKFKLPLLIEKPKIPHITGVITVTASCQFFTPMIVVPNKKKKK